MQREILGHNWKRFLIQLQESSAAVSASPAGMFFPRPHDLRWQPAYIHKRVARSDSSVSGTTARLTRTSKGLALELASD